MCTLSTQKRDAGPYTNYNPTLHKTETYNCTSCILTNLTENLKFNKISNKPGNKCSMHIQFFFIRKKAGSTTGIYIPIPLFFCRRAFIIVFNNSSWSTVLFFCVSRYIYCKQLLHVFLSYHETKKKSTSHT